MEFLIFFFFCSLDVRLVRSILEHYFFHLSVVHRATNLRFSVFVFHHRKSINHFFFSVVFVVMSMVIFFFHPISFYTYFSCNTIQTNSMHVHVHRDYTMRTKEAKHSMRGIYALHSSRSGGAASTVDELTQLIWSPVG